jgi:Ring finger domain
MAGEMNLHELSLRRFCSTKPLLLSLFWLLIQSSSIQAHVWIGWYPFPRYPSVAYNFHFNDPAFKELRKLFPDERLAGRPYFYNGTNTYPAISKEEDVYVQYPKVLVASFCYYGTQQGLMNITLAAKSIQADFILLVIQDELPRHTYGKAAFLFWWNQKLPQLDHYLSNSTHANENGVSEPFFVVIPPWFNDDFRSKLQPFLGTDDGFSFDDISFIKGSDLMAKIFMYAILAFCVGRWICKGHTHGAIRHSHRQTDDTQHPFHLIPFTSEDLGRGEIQSPTSDSPDCCVICLEAMPSGTSVCVLPCRHAFHPPCIDGWLLSNEFTWGGTSNTSSGYYCPLCKFDLRQHLIEHRAAREELSKMVQASSILVRLDMACKWLGSTRHQQQVLLEQSQGDGGDLELTVDDMHSSNAAQTIT